MTPRDIHRAGRQVGLIDKLRTISNLQEFEGFKEQIRKDKRELTQEEREMMANFKAELTRSRR